MQLIIFRHLEDHFRSDHFICEDPICIAQKYKVYLNSLDLTSHQLQAHPFIQVNIHEHKYMLHKYMLNI